VIQLVALDIAGTTVEEHQAVYRALEDSVVAYGATPTRADIDAWMGAGKREAIEALLTPSNQPEGPPAELVDAALSDFRNRLAAAYRATPPTPIPGTVETLTRLRAAGIKVALTTGFDREVTDGLLSTLGWDESLLDAVICIDDVGQGRPAPYMIFRAMEATGVLDVTRVLTAGDTVRDLEAGSNAGASLVLGVLTGGGSEASLTAAPHTHLLASIADIPDLLTRLGQPISCLALSR
jgi:phosphonatase-like hydrolase